MPTNFQINAPFHQFEKSNKIQIQKNHSTRGNKHPHPTYIDKNSVTISPLPKTTDSTAAGMLLINNHGI